MAKILVVAAHPDDEALGCGGTLAKHANTGDEVHILFMTDGESARGLTVANAQRRKEASLAAAEILGAKSPTFFDFPDNEMDVVPRIRIAQAIEDEMASLAPDIVYTHHAHDLNIDHRITHEAVMIALRPQPHAPKPTILSFEVPSSTEWQTPGAITAFIPNWYVDISAFMPAKKAALMAYHKEMRAWPHPRSLKAVEHLAHWRGACVGVKAAEALSLARNIV
jgi:N-acetylglucosamine malate deacetylase 1